MLCIYLNFNKKASQTHTHFSKEYTPKCFHSGDVWLFVNNSFFFNTKCFILNFIIKRNPTTIFKKYNRGPKKVSKT